MILFNPETALKLSRNVGKKNQCDSNYLFDEEEARTSWDYVATFGEQIAEERNVTVWVRRSHRTRLQTCLFKAWRPNPLGQLSAEHINYYTQSIACFFLNCYSGVFKDSEASFSLTVELESLPSEGVHA